MPLNADPTRLEQVLWNLHNNASKYSDHGGRIWLTLASEGDEVVFRIRDEGIGIASEMIPNIFDLFTQVDTSVDRSHGGLTLA
jgi:signal transduction histidine kinase